MRSTTVASAQGAPRGAPSGPRLVLWVTLVALAGGAALWLAGAGLGARLSWAVATSVALAGLIPSVARDLRRGDTGVDLIALLAMAGALVLGEFLAGAVVALMLSGGQRLEERAGERAERELTSLLERAPQAVHRYQGGILETVSPDDVEVGEVILVKQGEIVPTDGVLTSIAAVLDEAALTGESEPVERLAGDRIASGVVNAGAAIELHVAARVEDSTYAGIVRLVEEAATTKAPFTRLADRYAFWFLPATLSVSAMAWLLSGSPTRALAVLVVATPCPLILAAPVAIISGMSRIASQGVIVKGGAVLESLARADILLLDKTGTLTTGTSELAGVKTKDASPDDVLKAAASLDQFSPHVLAASIVRSARSQGLDLVFPRETREEAGSGIEGLVEGQRVAIGKAAWVTGGDPLPDWAAAVRRRAATEGSTDVYVAIDGRLAGVLLLRDPLRVDAIRAVSAARSLGFRRIIMITGDHPETARAVAVAVGVDEVLADRSPAEKVDAVHALRAEGSVVMVGDGINDAPALAAADVGVAMGARGATASSEAADVVIAVDRLDRLMEAVSVAKRSRRIAVQSVMAGMGMSFAGMFFAALGYLPPVAGALAQEAIDVAVIVNALRALVPGRRPLDHEPIREPEAIRRFRSEHRVLLPGIDELRDLAHRLEHLPAAEASARLNEASEFLVGDVMPHEEAEDRLLYPLLAPGKSDGAVAAAARMHLEIAHLVHALQSTVVSLAPHGPSADELAGLRRLLYALHTLLRAHVAREEDLFGRTAERAAGDGPIGTRVPGQTALGVTPYGGQAGPREQATRRL